jgi:hypothetical protein
VKKVFRVAGSLPAMKLFMVMPGSMSYRLIVRALVVSKRGVVSSP